MIVEKKIADFRIVVIDLKTGKSKTISIRNGVKTKEDILEKIKKIV